MVSQDIWVLFHFIWFLFDSLKPIGYFMCGILFCVVFRQNKQQLFPCTIVTELYL